MSEINTSLKPLVIIAGPTATGKSDLAVNLCLALDGAVISADSMQVYHDMAIGSARITPEEMKGVPHYLVDYVSPREPWNVVRFKTEAVRCYNEILAAGRLPFLVGGTGFYIDAFLKDTDFTAMDEDEDYREELSGIALREGPEALHRMLLAVDPRAAETIHPNNVKRVIRALEFSRSGKLISEHNMEEKKRVSPYHALYFVLTMERDRLYRRIEARVDRMFDAGLVDEVKALMETGLNENDVSMQGLGYRQVIRALKGEFSLDEARERIKTETRHFAKRQLTWFTNRQDTEMICMDDYGTAKALENALAARIRAELFI